MFNTPTSAVRVVQLQGLLFRLRVEISDQPEGRYLACLNIPGATVSYINVELRILGLLALYGHIKLY